MPAVTVRQFDNVDEFLDYLSKLALPAFEGVTYPLFLGTCDHGKDGKSHGLELVHPERDGRLVQALVPITSDEAVQVMSKLRDLRTVTNARFTIYHGRTYVLADA